MSKSWPTQQEENTPRSLQDKKQLWNLAVIHYQKMIFVEDILFYKLQNADNPPRLKNSVSFRALTLVMQQCKYFIATLQIQLEIPEVL